MKVISFGDSFTQGLGVDRLKEQSFFDENPGNKKKARALHRVFTNKHSFTQLFADKLGVDNINYGESGCNNRRIVSNIFDKYAQGDLKPGDLVLVCFTSTLRDHLPFTPDHNHKLWAGVTWSINELVDVFRDLGTKEDYISRDDLSLLQGLEITAVNKELSWFFREYTKFFVSEMFEFRYLDFFNFNMITLLQNFFKYIEVDYIFIDAFENTFNNTSYDKSQFVNKDKYWRYGEHSIFSYLDTFNNRELFEIEGFNIPSEHIPLHPSAEGHKVFTEDLYKFFKSKNPLI